MKKIEPGMVLTFDALEWRKPWEFDHPSAPLHPVVRYSENGDSVEHIIEEACIDACVYGELRSELDANEGIWAWRGYRLEFSIVDSAKGSGAARRRPESTTSRAGSACGSSWTTTARADVRAGRGRGPIFRVESRAAMGEATCKACGVARDGPELQCRLCRHGEGLSKRRVGSVGKRAIAEVNAVVEECP